MKDNLPIYGHWAKLVPIIKTDCMALLSKKTFQSCSEMHNECSKLNSNAAGQEASYLYFKSTNFVLRT
jgi:hypothetical protein